MNVLLSSVGRRSYLVHYFQEALRGQGRVIVTNSVAEASGMVAADRSYVVPLAEQDEHTERLVEICTDEEVGLLCSLHDWEGPFLAASLDLFRSVGVIPVVSSPEVIDVCLDKKATVEFCRANAIRIPATWSTPDEAVASMLRREALYPVIIKPRFGQGSIELYTAEDEVELRSYTSLVKRRLSKYASNGLLADRIGGDLLIQSFIWGEEYGLDVINDLQGRFVTCFVKRKIAMRAGETDIAETVECPELEALGRRIGSALGHVGVLDVDIIIDDHGPCLLEMNARFGGHYPFAHMAGANIPAALLAWAEGRAAEPAWLRVSPGVRCCKDICMVRLPMSDALDS
jgi:carbamoyl-phosphate synthase large subunit